MGRDQGKQQCSGPLTSTLTKVQLTKPKYENLLPRLNNTELHYEVKLPPYNF